MDCTDATKLINKKNKVRFMKKATFAVLLCVGMVQAQCASLILKETGPDGIENYYSFSISIDGKEDLKLFDQWDQVSSYYEQAFTIKEESRRAELQRRASEWLTSNLNYSFEIV